MCGLNERLLPSLFVIGLAGRLRWGLIWLCHDAVTDYQSMCFHYRGTWDGVLGWLFFDAATEDASYRGAGD